MSRYSPEQKKKHILAKLVRRGNVGEAYTPKQKAFSGIPKDQRGDLEGLLDEMHGEGLIEYHKGKACISINRHHKEVVRELLAEEVPEYYWRRF